MIFSTNSTSKLVAIATGQEVLIGLLEERAPAKNFGPAVRTTASRQKAKHAPRLSDGVIHPVTVRRIGA